MCHIFIHSSVDGHLGCFWQVILTFLPLIRIQFRIISFLKNFIYLLFIFGCVGSSFLCDAFLQLRQAGATPHRAARASHYRGLSCCGAQAPDAQAQQSWLTGPAAPWHVGSSQTRARNRVPCIGRQTLNHCAIREAPTFLFYEFKNYVYLTKWKVDKPTLISIFNLLLHEKQKHKNHWSSPTIHFQAENKSSPGVITWLAQIPDLRVVKMIQMILFTKQKLTHRSQNQIYGYQRGNKRWGKW